MANAKPYKVLVQCNLTTHVHASLTTVLIDLPKLTAETYILHKQLCWWPPEFGGMNLSFLDYSGAAEQVWPIQRPLDQYFHQITCLPSYAC